jgi:hypothetical protein
MTKITKEAVLENLEEVKKYIREAEQKTEEKKKVVIEIKNRFTGEVKFTSEKSTIKEVCQDNKADLSGADLRDANLYGADLREANFYEADLSGADLRGANFYGANLYGANLREANFSEADLSGADLRGANLYEAELQNAKFYGKHGATKIKKSQLNDFMKALGVIVDD